MVIDYRECRLQIGEFCCSLRFENAEWAASVRDYYKDYLQEKDPDIRIDFEIISHENRINIPNSLIIESIVNGNQFDFHSGLLNGSLDLPNRKATVKVKQCLLKNARVFDQFLYHVYYTLLKDRYPNQDPNHFLVHASGVVKDGKAYLFTGPSGSGKTTIAGLVPEYSILNDEIVIIGKCDGYFYAAGTPFGRQFKNRKNMTACLRAIFLIRHGERNYAKDLTPSEFVKYLFREVVLPIPLLSTDRVGALMERIDFCGKVAQGAPCYELYFMPDKSVWEYIKGILD